MHVSLRKRHLITHTRHLMTIIPSLFPFFLTLRKSSRLLSHPRDTFILYLIASNKFIPDEYIYVTNVTRLLTHAISDDYNLSSLSLYL